MKCEVDVGVFLWLGGCGGGGCCGGIDRFFGSAVGVDFGVCRVG